MFKQTLRRIISGGWTNFRRNSYVSFGTTGVMVLVLLMFLALIAVNFMSTTVVSSLQEKVDVSVYFKQEASEDQIFSVRNDIQNLQQVRSVEYISRDQALEDFKQRHAGDALIQESLAELDENPLQASLNIKAKQTSQYAAIVNFVESNKFRTLIDKINFYENEQVIRRVERITGAMQNWGFIASLVLAAIAVLVTFNTIRLSVYNQKAEIEIMRLVGGSNWHVRGPYLVEGSFYGLFAALLAAAVFYPAAYFISPKIMLLMPGVSLIGYFTSHSLVIVPLTVVLGVGLGVISSIIAIRRFLRI